MGTEVLRPQDCLIERMRVRPVISTTVIPRRKTNYSANSNPKPNNHKKPFVRSEQKKRLPQSDQSISKKSTPTIGKVTILKRGESDLGSVLPPNHQIQIIDLKSSSSCRSEVYAGSAFYSSPSPSSLPLPTFFSTRKQELGLAIVDDSATKDLRRLLRID